MQGHRNDQIDGTLKRDSAEAAFDQRAGQVGAPSVFQVMNRQPDRTGKLEAAVEGVKRRWVAIAIRADGDADEWPGAALAPVDG